MSFAERLAAIAARSASAAMFQSALDERRWALRKTSILAGFILSDRLQGKVPCVVRDLSATGARLKIQAGRSSVIATPADLPQRFTMLLEHEQVEIDCELQWTSDDGAGVRFISSMRHLVKKPRKIAPRTAR